MSVKKGNEFDRSELGHGFTNDFVSFGSITRLKNRGNELDFDNADLLLVTLNIELSVD